jgi:hypothetical protein
LGRPTKHNYDINKVKKLLNEGKAKSLRECARVLGYAQNENDEVIFVRWVERNYKKVYDFIDKKESA